MTPFEHSAYNKHRQLHFFENREVGLKTIIAIHHLVEGRSGGGCRFYPYQNDADALTDVLRLSRAMTYKFALADVPIGGAKAVIIGNPEINKNEALLEAFGRIVESLGGQYITAGDVGTNEEDMAIIKRATNHVVGVKGEGGDTSITTGYGVYQSIRAAVQFRYGRNNLQNIRVAIQGVGGVGLNLIKYLLEAGARPVIADTNPKALEKAQKLGVRKIVDPKAILFQETEVLAPCALGGILNKNSIPKIKAKIIAGGANNQLASDKDAESLHAKNILFVPDFIANSGGVMQGAGQMAGSDQEEIIARAKTIYDTTLTVLEMGEKKKITPLQAAYQLAERRLRR